MKVCYVAHPYSADTIYEIGENIKKAEEFAKRLALIGYAVIVPHNNTGFWDMDQRFINWKHEDWVNMTCAILAKCDVVAFCGKWYQSVGCREEFRLAKLLNKEILFLSNYNEI